VGISLLLRTLKVNCLLSINNLSVQFGGGPDPVKAVNDISLSIPAGGSLGLVGESGSGKSITALAIMGLLPVGARIASGSIHFEENDLLQDATNKISKLRGNRISMIFQEPMTSLNPVMRCGRQVAESIRLHQKLSREKARTRVFELFEKVRLPRPESIYRSYPHEISGGQKQRIMIAMAVANNPSLLIADEPTTALDVTVQKEIIRLLSDLRKEFKMSLLFISHDLGVISEVTEDVAVMYRGEIVETGPVGHVLKNPEHPYTRGLIACRPPENIRYRRLPTIDEFMEGDQEMKQTSIEIPEEARKKRLTALYRKQPVLDVKDLEKKYPVTQPFFWKATQYVHAVNKVSLQVYPGETLGLVGESGCGKTTLGRSILRLIDPDAGSIYFDEQDVLELKGRKLKDNSKKMNIIFQDPYSSLNPRISIGHAIREPMTVHGLFRDNTERKEKVMELLQKVGLEKEHYYRYPHEFSGGQRQRIVIARALALQPRFIICDEAVSALDVSVQARVLNLLNDLKEEFGFTYIFISHDLSVVRFMSDRVMVMKDGKIIETGDADDIYFHPKNEYTKKLIASIPSGN
jgi:peptide/nickel transport system ATP-binding protein